MPTLLPDPWLISTHIDIFIGLNAVRALSIIALLLLFASSIVTMVHDVQSVNAFIAAGKADTNIRAVDTNATDPDCITADTDYVEYVHGATIPRLDRRTNMYA